MASKIEQAIYHMCSLFVSINLLKANNQITICSPTRRAPVSIVLSQTEKLQESVVYTCELFSFSWTVSYMFVGT